jgi:ankyrin repeat protein
MAAMTTIRADEPPAVAAFEAIHPGDVQSLERHLVEHADLATARVTDPSCGDERTLLHVVADWPGHFPNGRDAVATLVAAGADVNAPFGGSHAETPLHWAASSDDVEVLDALVEAGADIEAPGSVIDGGSPLCRAAARRS